MCMVIWSRRKCWMGSSMTWKHGLLLLAVLFIDALPASFKQLGASMTTHSRLWLECRHPWFSNKTIIFIFIHMNKNKPCYSSCVSWKHYSLLYIIAAIFGGQKSPELKEYPETKLLRSEIDFRSLIWVEIRFFISVQPELLQFHSSNWLLLWLWANNHCPNWGLVTVLSTEIASEKDASVY